MFGWAAARRASVLVIKVTAAVVLVGCDMAPPGSLTASPDTSAASSADALRCEPINLITPQGNRVDLTGTWSGRGATHYVRQLGSCVWWIALSDIPGQPPGSAHSITFHGFIRTDFSLVGEWAFVIRPSRPDSPPLAMERITFTVEVEDADGEEAVVIRGPGADPQTGGPVVNFYSAISLERVGPLPASQ